VYDFLFVIIELFSLALTDERERQMDGIAIASIALAMRALRRAVKSIALNVC